MLSYVHPVVAGLVLALLAHTASLALRSRSDRRNAARWRQRHARVAPWAFALVAASWIGGLVSSWYLRPADEFAKTVHFQLGTVLVLLLAGSWSSSKWMQHRIVRQVHPWFGAAALLLAAGQLFFGLPLLP